jgi:large repetitive protein
VLSGGGKIALSSSGNNFFSVGTTVTLTNLDNTIAGAGGIGDGNTQLILINGGTINANTGNALTIDVPEPIVNSGIMEATASGGLFIDTNEGLNNTGGKIAALGKNAEVVVFAGSGIANGSGVISASGNGAHVDLDTRISVARSGPQAAA